MEKNGKVNVETPLPDDRPPISKRRDFDQDEESYKQAAAALTKEADETHD